MNCVILLLIIVLINNIFSYTFYFMAKQRLFESEYYKEQVDFLISTLFIVFIILKMPILFFILYILSKISIFLAIVSFALMILLPLIVGNLILIVKTKSFISLTKFISLVKEYTENYIYSSRVEY